MMLLPEVLGRPAQRAAAYLSSYVELPLVVSNAPLFGSTQIFADAQSSVNVPDKIAAHGVTLSAVTPFQSSVRNGYAGR